MKRLFVFLLAVFMALSFVACGGEREPELSEEEVWQQLANEYVIYFVENAGFVAETTARILRAGFNSAENGDRFALAFEVDGIIYFSVQSRTRGGGISTSEFVILVGGDRDKDIMTHENTDFGLLELALDVRQLNNAITDHWYSLGIESSP